MSPDRNRNGTGAADQPRAYIFQRKWLPDGLARTPEKADFRTTP